MSSASNPPDQALTPSVIVIFRALNHSILQECAHAVPTEVVVWLGAVGAVNSNTLS